MELQGDDGKKKKKGDCFSVNLTLILVQPSDRQNQYSLSDDWKSMKLEVSDCQSPFLSLI